MSGHCKDCRWFQTFSTGGGPQLEQTQLFPQTHAGCCGLASTWMTGPIHTDSLAYVDVEGNAAKGRLTVHPRFGCVQFEPRGKE